MFWFKASQRTSWVRSDNGVHIANIEIKKDGYATKTHVISSQFDVWPTLLDILFWPAVIVDAATGSMMELDKDTINSHLVKQ